MPEHYTKATVEATVWCNVCGKPTSHRIWDGRRGPCLVCLEAKGSEPAREKPAVQQSLFRSGGAG